MLLDWLHQTGLRLRALLMRRKLDRDLEDEIAFHLAMREAKSRSAGMSADEARAGSLKQFGNPAYLKETCRTMWTFHFWETVWQDLSYGARTLRKTPGFLVVAVLTLALGIGANTAIFSLTYEVLLSRLPVPHPEELVILRSPGPHNGHTHSDSSVPGTAFSYPDYKELRDGNSVFTGLLARLSIPVSTSGQGRSESLSGELVSGNYFQVLGVRPVLGRLLLPQDETAAGANPVVVLSYGYWERRYARDPDILNKPLTVNGTVLTVVGVAQAGFDGVQVGEMPDLFIPVTMKAQMTPNWNGLADRTDRWLALIGRMKPGINRQQAEAAVQSLYHQVLESDLPFMKYSKQEESAFMARKLLLDQGARGRPILEEQLGAPLIFLAAMVGLILLIACSNLASLLIARGEARHREIGVRLSLGAPRRRIVRQLLTENLLLAMAGGVAGLVLAYGILRTLSQPIQQSIGSLHVGAQLDFTMLAFAAGASLLTGILFGLAPALRVVHADPQSGLQDRTSKATGSRSNVRLRKSLMVFQVAMTVLLMAEAALFTQSLLNLKHTDLGMRTDNVVQFSVSPELTHHSPTQTIALVESLRKKLLTIPGVLRVGTTEVPLFSDDERTGNVTVEGYTFNNQDDEKAVVHKNLIGPGYFAAMETPLLSGREFSDSDVMSSPKVAIINQSMARRYFSGRDPIGRHFTFGGGQVHPDTEIVGVVKDSKYMGARDASVPFVFLPYAQDNKMGTANFYVRTAQDPVMLAETIRKTVAGLDDNLPVDNMKTLEQQLDISMFGERALAFLTLCLGGLALLLAAVGLYGVMAYVVARRTREIGIRIALGATRQGIAWLVVREVLRMMIIGLSIGIVLAFAVGRAISSLLFGVTPGNPGIMALTALVLAGVAILAGSVPARKAAHVDPIVALRYE